MSDEEIGNTKNIKDTKKLDIIEELEDEENNKNSCCSSKTNTMKTIFSILSIIVSSAIITLLSYFYPDIFKKENLDNLNKKIDSFIINKFENINSFKSTNTNSNYFLDICDNNFICLNTKIPIDFNNNFINSYTPINKLDNNEYIYLSENNINMYSKLFYNKFYYKLVNIIYDCVNNNNSSKYCSIITQNMKDLEILNTIKECCITDTIIVKYYFNNKFIGNYFAEVDIPEKIKRDKSQNIIVPDPLYTYDINNINISSYILYYTIQNIFDLDKYKDLSILIYNNKYILYKSTDKFINNRYFYNIDIDKNEDIAKDWIQKNKDHLINILKNIYEVDISKIGLSSIYIDNLYRRFIDNITNL